MGLNDTQVTSWVQSVSQSAQPPHLLLLHLVPPANLMGRWFTSHSVFSLFSKTSWTTDQHPPLPPLQKTSSANKTSDQKIVRQLFSLDASRAAFTPITVQLKGEHGCDDYKRIMWANSGTCASEVSVNRRGFIIRRQSGLDSKACVWSLNTQLSHPVQHQWYKMEPQRIF